MQHAQCMFLGGIEMSEFSNWQGYLVSSTENYFIISSPWSLSDRVVFGPDSDYNTLAVSLVQYMYSHGIGIDSLQSENSKLEMDFLNLALGFDESNSTSKWKIFCSDDAIVCISSSPDKKFSKPVNLIQVDESKNNLI